MPAPTLLQYASAAMDFEARLARDLNAELLRFTTAGSVDDGKSTLIGRLLHDSKSVYEDQLASVKQSRVNRSSGPMDFSLLTDGLRAEREQGITIDVAYRYFATAKRKFIIADTPGHEQYTRNMATGASTADLAIVLIDVTKGLLAQTRRHAFIASLLGIQTVVAAVNKMDLVGYRQEVFREMEEDFLELAAQLGIANVRCIPISALQGDNVVDRSARMGWYGGPTLLEHLETVPLPEGDSGAAFRFPIQLVIRPDASFRGFAGRVASGSVRPGDVVVALPSQRTTRVRSIVTYDGDVGEAFAPQSVTLRLEDEIDLSRGDMLVSPEDLPHIARSFRAMVVWLHASALALKQNYLLKHAGRTTRVRAERIFHRVNVNTLEREDAADLRMNEIALVELEATTPVFFDAYSKNRTTGSFILIDPISNATVGAGMIQSEANPSVHSDSGASLLPDELPSVSAHSRFERHGHYPGVLLLGGRSALGERLERELFNEQFEVLHLADRDVSLAALDAAISVAAEAGIVLIYSGHPLDGEVKRRIYANTKGRYFDASASAFSDNEDELFREASEAARSWRLAGR
jgi:bifunctional enzyme CysN/CysC/sulfate adenylyltransferase subunit 1